MSRNAEDEGKKWHLKKDFLQAMLCYHHAEEVVGGQNFDDLAAADISRRDVAELFSNHASALTEMGDINNAFVIVEAVIETDCTWFKVMPNNNTFLKHKIKQ